ncbi:shikimate dehydrogenase [Bartonella sp. TP]|uniref:shikimate dehydrogenase n=1 Tax=Bartonella sp. TP TaxID=3057550 RepID=UPI0025B07EFD|nr:shikimate dehydrogenase [Bartonella sp. TP]WJW79487.1 shikimate dehydrogenase [Bartonella sp. TP]
MKRVFLLGSNIENSLSPFIHNYWLKKYQLDGSYEALPMNIAQAPNFLRNFAKQGFVGGNVTMPFKKMAYHLSDKTTATVSAANLLWMEDGAIISGNSDAYGFHKLLAYNGLGKLKPDARSRSALVLGSGATSKAVVSVLAAKDYFIYIASRKVKESQEIGYNISQIPYWDIGSDYAMIINTTPCTMQNYDSTEFLELLNLPKIAKSNNRICIIDLAYVPFQTKLLEQAQKLGFEQMANGMVMLLEQAAYGFEKWFGVMPEVTPELLDILQEVL